ncbi:MAG: hypothetical protein ABI741_12345 [Ferruginibacter sp.]
MKTATLISIILFQLIFNSASCQLSQPQLDSVVRKYAKDLTKKGIDTICIYQQYCIGCFLSSQTDEPMCSQNILFFPSYIFWIDKGNTYITKKDACFDYSAPKIVNDSFWRFYLGNSDKIKKEELKKPQYKQKVNGKDQIQTMDIDRAVFYRIYFRMGKDTMLKNLNNFYFTEKLGPDEDKNLNYDFNIQTQLKKLQLYLQRAVSAELEKKRLIKTLR